MSGWVARSFCTMEVASGRGGVHTSSTTSSMPLAWRSFSRRGLKKKTVAAGLSPPTAAFRIGWVFPLGELDHEIEGLLGLRGRDGRGLERVLEAALRDAVGVRQRQPRHLHP